MKKLIFVFVLSVFIVFNFGFIPYGNSDINKNNPCPYMQQMKKSSVQSHLKSDDSRKSQCPYMNGEKSKCPFLNQGTERKESGRCPYSSEQGINKSNSDKKVRVLELKIS